MRLTLWKKTFLNFWIQWLFGEVPDVTSSWPWPELVTTGTAAGWLHHSCSSLKLDAQIRMPWIQWVWDMAQQRWWGRRRAGGCPPSVGALPGAPPFCDTGQPPQAHSCLQHQPARFPEPLDKRRLPLWLQFFTYTLPGNGWWRHIAVFCNLKWILPVSTVEINVFISPKWPICHIIPCPCFPHPV